MLLIRLTASDLRLIDKASSEPELQGVRQLVLDRIAQAKVLKEFGKTPAAPEPRYAWKDALSTAKTVLGEAVTKPPFPDYRWFQRINSALKGFGMTDAKVREVAEHALKHLLNHRKTISFDFLICQHQRILAGEFDGQGSLWPEKWRNGEKRVRTEADNKAETGAIGPELPED